MHTLSFKSFNGENAKNEVRAIVPNASYFRTFAGITTVFSSNSDCVAVVEDGTDVQPAATLTLWIE